MRDVPKHQSPVRGNRRDCRCLDGEAAPPRVVVGLDAEERIAMPIEAECLDVGVERLRVAETVSPLEPRSPKQKIVGAHKRTEAHPTSRSCTATASTVEPDTDAGANISDGPVPPGCVDEAARRPRVAVSVSSRGGSAPARGLAESGDVLGRLQGLAPRDTPALGTPPLFRKARMIAVSRRRKAQPDVLVANVRDVTGAEGLSCFRGSAGLHRALATGVGTHGAGASPEQPGRHPSPRAVGRVALLLLLAVAQQSDQHDCDDGGDGIAHVDLHSSCLRRTHHGPSTHLGASSERA